MFRIPHLPFFVHMGVDEGILECHLRVKRTAESRQDFFCLLTCLINRKDNFSIFPKIIMLGGTEQKKKLRKEKVKEGRSEARVGSRGKFLDEFCGQAAKPFLKDRNRSDVSK